MRALLISLLIALGLCAQALAEKPFTPKAILWQEPFVLDVTILSIEVKPGPHTGSSVWHRVRVDRVERGEGIAVGAETPVRGQRAA